MTLRFKTLKPGSLILSKRYSLFKRLWYKLRKKDLQYNTITLFTSNVSIFDTYNENSSETLIELKKNYSKEELARLTSLIEEYTNERDITVISFKRRADKQELADILNSIRPNSLLIDSSFEKFKKNLYKNYHVKRLAEEKNWDVCIY